MSVQGLGIDSSHCRGIPCSGFLAAAGFCGEFRFLLHIFAVSSIDTAQPDNKSKMIFHNSGNPPVVMKALLDIAAT